MVFVIFGGGRVLDEGFFVENKKVGFLVANKNQGRCCCFKVDDDDGDGDDDADAFVCVLPKIVLYYCGFTCHFKALIINM